MKADMTIRLQPNQEQKYKLHTYEELKAELQSNWQKLMEKKRKCLGRASKDQVERFHQARWFTVARREVINNFILSEYAASRDRIGNILHNSPTNYPAQYVIFLNALAEHVSTIQTLFLRLNKILNIKCTLYFIGKRISVIIRHKLE